MSDLQSLYREVILDHSRHPQGAGLREPFTVEVHQVNPTCGDEVRLRVALDGEGAGARVTDVSHHSVGCSISVAATSVLSGTVVGVDVEHALAEYDRFHDIVTGAEVPDGAAAAEDDAAAFAGVAKFPQRVKCALLGWTALRQALVRAGAADDRPGD